MNDFSTIDALSLARSYRKLQSLCPESNTKTTLRDQISDSIISKITSQAILQQTQNRVQNPVQNRQNLAQLQNILDQSTSWDSVKTEVFNLTRNWSQPEAIAQAIELSFLHSGCSPCLELFSQVREKFRLEAMEKIYQTLRCQLNFFCYSQHKKDHPFFQTWEQKWRRTKWSQPESVLGLLYTDLEGEKKYFSQVARHIPEFIESIKDQTIQSWLPGSKNKSLIRLAKAAEKHQDNSLSLEILSHISIKEDQQNPAIDMYLKTYAAEKPLQKHPLLKKLKSIANLDYQIDFFDALLNCFQTPHESIPTNRLIKPMIACLFPFEWLNNTADGWRGFSKTLWKNRSFERYSPRCWHYFEHKKVSAPIHDAELAAWIFLSERLENQLTPPQARLVAKSKLLTWYHRSHLKTESSIFKLYMDYRKLAKVNGQILDDWKECWKLISNDLKINSSTQHPIISQRQQILLTSLVNLKNIRIHGLEPLLADSDSVVEKELLAEITLEARHSHNFSIELCAILKQKNCYQNWTNSDIRRILFLATKLEKNDLAWSSLSLLTNRHCLNSSELSIWTFSPENTNRQNLRPLSREDIDLALSGFIPAIRRMLWAISKLSQPLTELAIATNILGPRELNTLTSSTQHKPSFCNQIQKNIESSKIIASINFKKIRIGHQQPPEYAYPVPLFASTLPENSFSYLVSHLSYRLSLPFWKMNTKYLFLLSRPPSLKTANTEQTPNEQQHKNYLEWKSRLNNQQKNLWQDFLNSSGKASTLDSFESLSKFVCRLALLMHPNHALALKTLKEMRAPLTSIWDLEKFILSEGYTKHREKFHLSYETKFPNMD